MPKPEVCQSSVLYCCVSKFIFWSIWIKPDFGYQIKILPIYCVGVSSPVKMHLLYSSYLTSLWTISFFIFLLFALDYTTHFSCVLHLTNISFATWPDNPCPNESFTGFITVLSLRGLEHCFAIYPLQEPPCKVGNSFTKRDDSHPIYSFHIFLLVPSLWTLWILNMPNFLVMITIYADTMPVCITK